MFRSPYSLSLVLFMLLSTGSRAQVVNIEGRRFMNDSVPWTGFANFRFNVSENGQRALGLGLTGAIQYIRGHDRYFFINDLAFSQVEENDFLNTGFQHLRYNKECDSSWTAEAFIQTQYNKPLQLDLRLTIGAGPRFTAVDNKSIRVNVGSSLMYENENVTDGTTSNVGRSSTYVSVLFKFSELASLTTVMYYQPKLFDASDHRVALEGGLLINVTKRMTIESRLNLLKDTRQPEGVQPLSYSWNNMFGIRF